MKKFLKNVFKHTITILMYIIIPVLLIFSPLILFYVSKDLWGMVNINIGPINMDGKDAYNYITTIIIIMMLVIVVIIRKINKQRVFIDQNVYANYPMCIYYIAYYILGYSKIKLALKPYYISMKLILNGMFEIIDDIPLIDENCEVTTDYSKFTGNSNIIECNIIISDTYEIKENQIPLSKRNIDTIKINRVNVDEGKRVFCQKLIDQVNVAFAKITNKNTIINLYTTVNPVHFNRIVSDVLKKGGRDTYTICLFQQEREEGRVFKKSKKISIS